MRSGRSVENVPRSRLLSALDRDHPIKQVAQQTPLDACDRNDKQRRLPCWGAHESQHNKGDPRDARAYDARTRDSVWRHALTDEQSRRRGGPSRVAGLDRPACKSGYGLHKVAAEGYPIGHRRFKPPPVCFLRSALRHRAGTCILRRLTAKSVGGQVRTIGSSEAGAERRIFDAFGERNARLVI